jgi:selenocysteine lyase/cysteine desulfurase
VLSLFDFGRYDFADKRTQVAIRLSPHYYNTDQEIDAAVDAVGDFVRRP